MPEAWRMALDFARYKRDEAQDRGEARRLRHKTYRYLQAGKEVEVGLDFEEIVSLELLDGQEENGSSERRLKRDSEDR